MAEQSPRYEIFHDVLADAILDWRRRYEQNRETEEVARRLEEERRKQLAEQRSRHQARMFRIFRWGAVALGLLVIALAVAVFLALREGRIAESRGLASAAQAQLEADPELSVLLAREAWEAEQTDEAREAMRSAISASQVRARIDVGTAAFDAAWSPTTANFIATAGERAVSFWKGFDGSPVGESILTGRGAVFEFSADGDRLIAAGSGGAFIETLPPGGSPIELEQQSPVFAVAISSDGRYVATMSGRGLLISSGATGERLRRLPLRRTSPFPGVDIEFSPTDKALLAIATSSDDNVRIWDWRRGEVEVLKRAGEPFSHPFGFSDELTAVIAFSPDGRLLATAVRTRNTRIWEPRSGRLVQELFEAGGEVTNLDWSPEKGDPHLLVTAGVHVLEFDASGNFTQPLGPHAGAVDARYSPDGSRIVTADVDGTARVWDAAAGRLLGAGALINEIRGHGGGLSSVDFSPSGHRVLTSSDDGTARIWDVATRLEVQAHTEAVFDVAYSPEGDRLATAAENGTARVWTSEGDLVTRVETDNLNTAMDVEFTSDGERVLIAGNGRASYEAGRLLLANADSGEVLTHLSLRTSVSDVALSPDGDKALVTGPFKLPKLWDVSEREREETQLSYPEGTGSPRTVGVDYSPNGELIVTGGYDGVARVFEASSGRELQTFDDHEGEVLGAAFSPDSTRVVSFSRDGTARVWDTLTGMEIALLRGHTSLVSSAAFSPDGDRVVTGSGDRTVRVWDADTGELLAIERHHAAPVNSVEFSPDGESIISGSDDRTVKITSCHTCGDTGELLELAEERTTRDLTEIEESEFLGED
jgi:WD40 repeat protein